jgi:hypothetical protein
MFDYLKETTMTNAVHSLTLPRHMSAERAGMAANSRIVPAGLLTGFVDAVKRLVDRESAASASWDAWSTWGM